LLVALKNNHLAFTVRSDVVACLRKIGGVNAGRDATYETELKRMTLLYLSINSPAMILPQLAISHSGELKPRMLMMLNVFTSR
jgi:hypothetical protein